MIIVRMGLSVAWQNDSQNRSFLTTLPYNEQPTMPAQPHSNFMQAIGMGNTITTFDESQSTGTTGTPSNYKRKSFLPTWTASGGNGMVQVVI